MRGGLADGGACSPRLLPTVTRSRSSSLCDRRLRGSGFECQAQARSTLFSVHRSITGARNSRYALPVVQLCLVERAESYHVDRLLLVLLFSLVLFRLLQSYGCINIQTMATSAVLLEQCVSYPMPFVSPVTRHRPRCIVHVFAARGSGHGRGRRSSQCSVCVSEQTQFDNASHTTSEQGRLLDRTAVNRRSLGVAAVLLSFTTPLQTLAGE